MKWWYRFLPHWWPFQCSRGHWVDYIDVADFRPVICYRCAQTEHEADHMPPYL